MIDAGMTMDVGEGEDEVTLSCSDAADCAFTVDEDGMATAYIWRSHRSNVGSCHAGYCVIGKKKNDKLKVVADTKAAATKTKAIKAETEASSKQLMLVSVELPGPTRILQMTMMLTTSDDPYTG